MSTFQYPLLIRGWPTGQSITYTVTDLSNTTRIAATAMTELTNGAYQATATLNPAWGEFLRVKYDNGGGLVDYDVLINVPPAQGIGVGTGDVLITQDYGGSDLYRVMYNGLPVDGADIYAFEATSYGPAATPNAQTRTGSDGRWIYGIMLDPGSYRLQFSKPGQFVDQVLTLTVT